MTVVGISGFISCGKGTVATQLTEQHGFRKDSFAASLKDACAVMFDWPRDMLEGESAASREWREQVDQWWSIKLGIPNLTPRLALQLVGTDALRNNFSDAIWFTTLENRIRKNPSQHVVISDVRFPNEIKFVQDMGGVMIKVNRGPAPVWYETAILANKGNSIARNIMTTLYSGAHFSEWAWVGAKFDYEINNNGSVADLQKQITDILSTDLITRR